MANSTNPADRNWLWFLEAALVPPSFYLAIITLASFEDNFLRQVASSSSLVHHFLRWIYNVLKVSFFFGMVPFVIAFVIIGLKQKIWNDPSLDRRSTGSTGD